MRAWCASGASAARAALILDRDLGHHEHVVGRTGEDGPGFHDVVLVHDGVLDARAALDDTTLHDDGVGHVGAALDDDVAREGGAAHGAVDAAACGDV